jgi:hypothetical protein
MGVAGRILITISVVAKTFLQLAVWNGICLTAVRVYQDEPVDGAFSELGEAQNLLLQLLPHAAPFPLVFR